MVQEYELGIQPQTEELPPSGPPPPVGSPVGFAPPAPFEQAPYIAWVNVSADSIIATGPALLWAVTLRSSDGGNVIVFEGVNANGRRAFSLGTVIAVVDTVVFAPAKPLLFRNGIFVDVAGTIQDVMVAFEPVREEQIPFLRYSP